MKIFGAIGHVASNTGLAVFELTLLVLVCLDQCLEFLEKLAAAHDHSELYEKLKKELLQLGIISFALFIGQAAGAKFFDEENNLLAFETTHVIILFMVFAFVVQGCFLLQYSQHLSKSYLLVVRRDVKEILHDYRDFEESATWLEKLRFSHASSWTLFVPTIRRHMERKIFEKLILMSYNFPKEFNSAKYMSKLFKDYISKLGHISKFSWCILGCLGLMNYLRIRAIDPAVYTCPSTATASHTDPSHTDPSHPTEASSRALATSHAASLDPTCVQNLLIYSFIAAICLSLFLLGVFTAAVVYYDSCIALALKDGGYPDLGPQRRNLANFLGLSRRQSQWGDDWVTADTVDIHAVAKTARKEEKVRVHQKLAKKYTSSYKAMASLSGDNFQSRLGNFFYSLFWGRKRDKLLYQNTAVERLFLGNSPAYFFLAVETAIFLQCVYVSIALTELIPMAHDSHNTTAWIFAFLVVIVNNFHVIMRILQKSVVLQSVLQVDQEIYLKVCEECAYEREATTFLGVRIRRHLQDQNIAEEDYITRIRQIFLKFDIDHGGTLSKDEFLELLASIDIYMTHESFDLLWTAIDYDVSGAVSWDELAALVFPELRNLLHLEATIAERLRAEIGAVYGNEDGSVDRSLFAMRLQRQFEGIDANKNGALEKEEFELMLKDLGLRLEHRSFDALFATLARNSDGTVGDTISFHKFRSLVAPEEVDVSAVEPVGSDLDSDSGSGSGRQLFTAGPKSCEGLLIGISSEDVDAKLDAKLDIMEASMPDLGGRKIGPHSPLGSPDLAADYKPGESRLESRRDSLPAFVPFSHKLHAFDSDNHLVELGGDEESRQ